MKIGLIQSQGIGDIIIGLPIAKWYVDRGHKVFWPIHPFYLEFMVPAAPYVKFLSIPVVATDTFIGFSYEKPLQILQDSGCEKIFVLNMNLPEGPTLNSKLAGSLKFDEYKYAIAGVPFSEKWNLSIERDMGRELALHKSLGLGDAEYVCVNFIGSTVVREAILPQTWLKKYRIVHIESLTTNPLDWLYTIEHAARRVMIDSLFSNLTEQLNIIGNNYLVQRSLTGLTPVYKNGWTFVWPSDPIPDDG